MVLSVAISTDNQASMYVHITLDSKSQVRNKHINDYELRTNRKRKERTNQITYSN